MTARALMCFLAGLALPFSPLPAAGNSDPVLGLWLTANQRAIVEIAPCGAEACGRMVWVADSVDATGRLKRDANNTDEAKRNRPLCGLELVGGLHRKGDGAWSEGWLYNPKNGATYSADVRALSRQEIEVRGYLGVSMLGKSQVWTRVGSDRGGCPG